MDTYLRRPISGEAPESLVIFLHGLGANGQDLIGISQHWAQTLPNTEFISPDAPEHCDMAPADMPDSRQWFSLQDRRPEFLLQGVKKGALYLNAYLDQQMENYNLPADRIALVGFSQGTMLALYVALRRKNPLACLLGYSGALVGGEEFKDESDKATKLPVFLRHGEDDMVVPVDAFHLAKSTLEQLGLEVDGETAKDLAHGIDDEGITKGGAFLEKHLS